MTSKSSEGCCISSCDGTYIRDGEMKEIIGISASGKYRFKILDPA